MYVPDYELVKESLRQGDVLSGVLAMGAINVQGVTFNVNANSEKVGWSVPVRPEHVDVAVLSHSCEVDRANGAKVTSIIVAPLRDIHTATVPAKIEELKASNVISEDTEGSYLKYFYLSSNEKLQHRTGAVVDFSKCFSIRKNAYDYLVSRKILQLADDIRDAFALKLALYFCRSQQPIQAAKAAA